MTLEEFFTVSEAKEGITSPTRVEELISLLRKEKDCEVKSAVETTKLHSAIARAIAETKDTGCLDHFIKLGGLWYINEWLNDALKSDTDTDGDFKEESVILQCRALEKLGIGSEKLLSSEILDTIKNLCDHSSTIINKKARELLNTWKNVDLSSASNDVEIVDAFGDNEGDEAMLKTYEDGTLMKASAGGLGITEPSQSFAEPAEEKVSNGTGSDSLQLVEVGVIQTEATEGQMPAPVPLDQMHLDGGASCAVSNVGLNIPEAVCCTVTPAEGIVNADNSKYLEVKEDIDDENPGAKKNSNNEKITDKTDSGSEDLVVNWTRTSYSHKNPKVVLQLLSL